MIYKILKLKSGEELIAEITDKNSTETFLVLKNNFYKLYKGVIPAKLFIYKNKSTIKKIIKILEKMKLGLINFSE